MAIALNRRHIPVTYLLAANEGHGFAESETALAVNRATEEFLGKCLGGRVQPSLSYPRSMGIAKRIAATAPSPTDPNQTYREPVSAAIAPSAIDICRRATAAA